MKVVQDIRSDITNLPNISSFQEAITSILKINMLQRELVTMGKGLTDTELIMTHTGKLTSDRRFTAIKLKYLQGELSTVAGSEPKWIHKVKETKPSVETNTTWEQYTEDVYRYHRTEGTVEDESSAVAMAAQQKSNESEELKLIKEELASMKRLLLEKINPKSSGQNRSNEKASIPQHNWRSKESCYQSEPHQQAGSRNRQFRNNPNTNNPQFRPNQSSWTNSRQSQGPQKQFPNKRTFSAISDDSPHNPSCADDNENIEYEPPLYDREFDDDTTYDVNDQDT